MLIDDYVLDVLMRDLTQHDKRPSAFLVYLYLWRHTAGIDQKTVPASYQEIAEGTGLSKSAAQNAVVLLKRRRLISVKLISRTAKPIYRVERPWRRTSRQS